MTGIHVAALIVAVLAAFVMSAVWYIVFSKQRLALSGAAAANRNRPQPLKMLGELIRTFLLAGVLGYLLAHTGVGSLTGAVRLALVLWIGFPFVLLTGSVNRPRMIHRNLNLGRVRCRLRRTASVYAFNIRLL